ncbi:MAG: hypothetical protein H8E66_12010 [Planctomycetes bacterium]|nr:hypothetical protein [Planctomycetota bacterium]MBL7043244.1 hypothetical protein [Pirellulaceae bacterium]
MLARIFLIASVFAASPLDAAEPPITSATFTLDGKSIVVGSQSGLKVYALPDLAKQRTLDTSLTHINDLAFSPDGKTIAAVGGQAAESGDIELLAWPELSLVRRQTVGEDLLYRVAWRNDCEMIGVAGSDHSISLLDGSAHIVHQLEGHSQDVVAVAFLPDGYFVSGSRDSTLRVWQQSSKDLIRTLNNHTNEIHDVAARPGPTKPPHVIASSSADRTVRFWLPVRGRLMRFAKLPSAALDIEWTSDGAMLVAACADGHVRIIDPDTVQIVRDVEVGNGWLYTIAISPNGDDLFVGGVNGLMQVVKIR